MADRIVIVGAGAHARVVYDILLACGEAENIAAFVDVEGKMPEDQRIADKPLISGLAAFEQYAAEHELTAALGHGNNSRRKALTSWIEQRGIRTRTAVHPSAVISAGIEIGPMTTVSAGAIILTSARLGKAVIVNTAATVDHDCVVGDFAQLAPGSHLAGRVTVGAEAFVGIGAVVIQNVTVGAGCVIGAGAAVVRNTPDQTLVIGVPARVRRHL